MFLLPFRGLRVLLYIPILFVFSGCEDPNSVNLAPAPGFKFNTSTLEFRSKDTASFEIKNIHSTGLKWTVSKVPDWIKGLKSQSQKIEGGAQTSVNIYVETSKMQPGDNKGEIIISA